MDPIFLGPDLVSEPSIHTTSVASQFQFGQIDATIVTYTPTKKDSSGLNNTLSLQLNTNEFPGIGGDRYMYQFVLSTRGYTPNYLSVGNSICIKPVDRSVACQGAVEAGEPCANLAGYNIDNKCLGGNSGIPYIGSARGFQAFDFATMAVSTFTDNNVAKIGLVVQFSWFDPTHDYTLDGNGSGLYCLVTTDDFGLGLPGNWQDVGGTFIGFSGGSEAMFAAPSSVLTRTLGGSCVILGSGPFAGIEWPGACPNGYTSFPFTQNAMDHITGETNNLSIVADPSALVSYEPDLVFTEYLASTDGTCQPDSGLAYVKDSAEDTGVIPTNIGGQPFWESPDILFALPGENVDMNATASGSLLSFGTTYNFWVRVHNDLGCSDAKGVKAKLYVANPSGLMQEWGSSITNGYSVGPDQPPGGITVPARQAATIGPFTWTAPQGTGTLHRCLLAAITSNTQGAPQNADGTLLEAYLSNQVAQRNVQFEDCSWPLPSTQPGKVKITLTVNGAQPQLAGLANDIQVVFDDPDGTWNTMWNPPPSNNYTSTYDGTTGKTTVRLGTSPVGLAAVPIAANANPVATVTITEVQETTSVAFNASLTLDNTDGSTQPIKLNGLTCTYKYEMIQ